MHIRHVHSENCISVKFESWQGLKHMQIINFDDDVNNRDIYKP